MFAALVVIALATGTEPPKPQKEKALPEAAQKELDKLQGKWKVVLMSRSGKEYKVGPNDPELIIEFKGPKWVLNAVEKAEVVSLDPKTDPKCMDLKSLEKARGDVVDEAIYTLIGDTLTVCLYQGKGKNRPTEFDTSKNNDTILVACERVKEKPKK